MARHGRRSSRPRVTWRRARPARPGRPARCASRASARRSATGPPPAGGAGGPAGRPRVPRDAPAAPTPLRRRRGLRAVRLAGRRPSCARRRRPRGCRVDATRRGDRRAAAQGSYFTTPTSRASTCACSPSARAERRRRAGRAPADRGRRRRCASVLIVLLVVGAGGIPLAAVLGGVVARAALAPVARFTRRTEALTGEPRPLAAPGGRGRGRARAAGPQLQRDARRARALGRGAAPPRRRRQPRAAHADRQPAREHPGAARTPTGCPRRSARRCAPTSSPSSTS